MRGMTRVVVEDVDDRHNGAVA
jgi:hypothetical protein